MSDKDNNKLYQPEWIRLNYKQATDKFDGLKAPPRDEIAISTTCNNNCLFCLEGGRDVVRETLSLEDAPDVIRKFRKNYSELKIAGGEPTLNPDINKYVRIARQNDFDRITVITNGRRLRDKDFCRGLLEDGVNNFTVSLHTSVPEIQDAISCVTGAFDQVSRGLVNLKELKDEFDFDLVANVVICRLNIDGMADTYRFLDSMRFDKMNFQRVQFDQTMHAAFDDVKISISQYAKGLLAAFASSPEVFPKLYIVSLPMCHGKGLEELAGQHSPEKREKRADIEDVEKKHSEPFKAPACAPCACRSKCCSVEEMYIDIYGQDELVPFSSC